jgi:hypothetical protein
MRIDHDTDTNVTYTISKITDHVPPYGRAKSVPRGVIFVDSPLSRFQLLDALQFFTDADLYTMDTFSPMMPLQFRLTEERATQDPGKPSPLQPARRDYFAKVMEHMTGADLLHEQQRITRDALDQGRPVFVVVHAESIASYRREYLVGMHLTARLVSAWKEQEIKPTQIQSRFGPAFVNLLFNMPGAQSYELYQIEPVPDSVIAPLTAPAKLSSATAPSAGGPAVIMPATSRS